MVYVIDCIADEKYYILIDKYNKQIRINKSNSLEKIIKLIGDENIIKIIK